MIEILITNNKNQEKIALVENGILIEYYENNESTERKEGNIYLGKVKDIIKGMQAAFIDIGTEKNAFIHLKDILPKIDETKEQLNTETDIKDIVKKGQNLLVQIKKDSNEQKGARVSTHINLPSKYIVLMPNTNIITNSQKIESKEEKERLYKIVKENINPKNGAVIRTAAEGKNEEIIEDIKKVEKTWQEIEKDYEKRTKEKEPEVGLIYKAEDIIYKMLIDLAEKNITKIIIDNEEKYQEIKDFIKKDNQLKNIKIEKTEEKDLFSTYDIEKQIEKIQKRRIWLKSGGFITIDKTEALTAIDVNTGKFTGNKDLEQTIYTVNREATIEIAKQIRLRDIGGIIIIDYIDMHKPENKQKIEELLKEKLKEDRSKTQVEGFTKLDLMEMTRKHICSHQ